jgi:hypothetical protein
MKKFIAALVAAAMLIATPAIAGFKNTNPFNKVGVKASYKALEIQHQDDKTWVMVEDRIRVQERLANNSDRGVPSRVVGIHQGNGDYLIYITMGFWTMPFGVFDMDTLKTIVPVFNTLDGMYPAQFMTFAGFEDIWVYMDTTEGQEDFALSVIRDLNQKALDAEGVR